jgi:hypothetical protein
MPYGADPTEPPATGGYGKDPTQLAWQKMRGGGEQADAGESTLGALWKGFLHGAGDVPYGVAQIAQHAAAPFKQPIQRAVNALRMGGGPQGQQPPDMDQMIRQREQVYEQSPAVRAHPIASGAGRLAGEMAATAPLAAIGGAATIPGRIGMGAVTGALAAAAQPVTGRNFATEKLKQAGLGAGGGLAGEALGSVLGKAIAGNSPQAVEAALTRNYRQAVKPGLVGPKNFSRLASADRNMLGAVDSIINERQHLTFDDPSGGAPIIGKLPKTLSQFSDAIEQVKSTLFKSYDQKVSQAGPRVDMAPVVQEMRQLASSPELALPSNSALKTSLLKDADHFEKVGSYSTEDAQQLIQHLNKKIQSAYRAGGQEAVSYSTAMAPVLKTFRSELDSAVTQFQGPGYQALRDQYMRLRSIEEGVAKAVNREGNKVPGGFGAHLVDLGLSGVALHALATANLKELGVAAATKAAQYALRWYNSPNRAIERLFANRLASQTPPSALQQGIGSALPGIGALGGGLTVREVGQPGPQGGTITGIDQLR